MIKLISNSTLTSFRLIKLNFCTRSCYSAYHRYNEIVTALHTAELKNLAIKKLEYVPWTNNNSIDEKKMLSLFELVQSLQLIEETQGHHPTHSSSCQAILQSRLETDDFSGLSEIALCTLQNTHTSDQLSSKYELERNVINQFMNAITKAKIEPTKLLPLWSWTASTIPFIHFHKRQLLDKLAAEFIYQVSKMSHLCAQHLRSSIYSKIKYWALATNLNLDIRHYITPHPNYTHCANNHLLYFKSTSSKSIQNPIDVNTINIGIEFSGCFPLQQLSYSGEGSVTPLENGRNPWLCTLIDLTYSERKELLKSVAIELQNNLHGEGTVTQLSNDPHGHGIDICFTITDSHTRQWRVEWDGMSRNYSPNGELIKKSSRGGTVELITPKFIPTIEDIAAVYKTFHSYNIIPTAHTGGGHINIDLAPFHKKPNVLARFITLFYQYRGIITLMFQHISRLKAAQPIELSIKLQHQLIDFKGSEEELKTLLYNETFFNSRVGRKTRYAQLDLCAYFQDIIPAQYLTSNYDILSSTAIWRKQFRVDPNIRKMELRLFDAPKNTYESTLQIQLVRALLDVSFNHTSALSGTLQKVSNEHYLQNTDLAMLDLKEMCKSLGLKYTEYYPMISQGLINTHLAMQKNSYYPLSYKLEFCPKSLHWLPAVTPRNSKNMINSATHQWDPHNQWQIEAANTGVILEDQLLAAHTNYLLRTNQVSNSLPHYLFFREACVL